MKPFRYVQSFVDRKTGAAAKRAASVTIMQ
jgi:hypothetical protein